MRALRALLARLWLDVTLWRVGVSERMHNWLDPLAGTDEVRYKTFKEIALENAADSLGMDVDDPYLDEDEIPEEGVDYDPLEITPEIRDRLSADREEMIVYIERMNARTRRRRRVRRRRAAVLAAAVLMSAAAAGAAAEILLTGSTGVPAIDQVLSISEEARKPPLPPSTPGVDSASEPVSIPWKSQEGTSAVGVAYLSGRTDLCFSLAVPDDISHVTGAGAVQCQSLAAVASALADHRFFVMTINFRRTVTITGVAAVNIATVEATGPMGEFETRLGPPWVPPVDGSQAVRPFVAFRYVGATDDSPSVDLQDPRGYSVMAKALDGKTYQSPLFSASP